MRVDGILWGFSAILRERNAPSAVASEDVQLLGQSETLADEVGGGGECVEGRRRGRGCILMSA